MRIEVLDYGYVELKDSWGSDETFIEAARMSTNKGFQGWGDQKRFCDHCGKEATPLEITYNTTCVHCFKCQLVDKKVTGDEKLLKYLYDHKHMTPFEMGGLHIEVQAPIFVFREWHRHRTQSYNEMSARYVPLPRVDYMPSIERIMLNGGTNKQAGSTGAQTTVEYAEDFRAALANHYSAADALYRVSLGAAGIPKEVARLCLPVGRYSRMRASANLRNWLQFLTLRMDAHAQWEIRQYANAVGEIVADKFPRTWELFRNAGN